MLKKSWVQHTTVGRGMYHRVGCKIWPIYYRGCAAGTVTLAVARGAAGGARARRGAVPLIVEGRLIG